MARTVSGAEFDSGNAHFPNHTVRLVPAGEPVRVVVGGEIVAESDHAIRLEESRYDPVYYIPREDVQMEKLVRTEHHTVCPFKGEASYWSIRVAAGELANACWSYEDPILDLAGVKDLIAFYPNMADISVG